MINKHTPAPWVFRTMGGNKKTPVIAAPNGRKKKHELFETVARFNEKSVNEANARLIAAAPELLEALEQITWKLSHGADDAPNTISRKDATIHMAKEAINKARGIK